jgi:hypothetical protein
MLDDHSVLNLTADEATRIARAVAIDFADYVARYDTRKYPPQVYERLLFAFGTPAHVTPKDLEEAVLWKFGHLGKSGYPKHHARLITDLQAHWPHFIQSGAGSPEAVSQFWTQTLARPKAFITVAFLTHLLHQDRLPIIDQHNFRAVNHYLSTVRQSWVSKRAPTAMRDVALIAEFIDAVRRAWPPGSALPSARDLDKYLMMFGKGLKKRRSAKTTASAYRLPGADPGSERLV